MNIVIRKAREDELKIIQDLNYKLFLWDYDRDPTLNLEWTYSEEGELYFKQKISGEKGACFVAEVNGELVGYATVTVQKEISKADTVLRSELDTIYVMDKYRDKGVGTLLTEEFFKWAKEHGAQSALVVAYSENKDAITFYETRGFKPYSLKLDDFYDIRPSASRSTAKTLSDVNAL